MVPGRRAMTRAILGRQPRRNTDLAIAIIQPMPNQEVSFTGIRNVLDDFLREHLRVHYRSIQPCPVGQAFVRFSHPYDRDRLIHESPHPFGNVNISFIQHDKAWNHKRVTMNYEVWLMFLGLNPDHWNNHLVDKALADWGRLITWEEDPTHLSRILVKARVASLQEIPWFIFTSEGDDFEGDTWIAQCEIIQTRMLGDQAPDEDDPPNGPEDVHPNLFDFLAMVSQDKDLNLQLIPREMPQMLRGGVYGLNLRIQVLKMCRISNLLNNFPNNLIKIWWQENPFWN